MIVIVGHGPSVGHVSLDIDQHKVIRLRRAEPILGSRTDVICSSQARYQQPDIEFWHLVGDTAQYVRSVLAPYKPKFSKPSTGLSATILARRQWPDEEIGVAGFDFTLHPEMACDWVRGKKRHNRWIHDAYAENRCITDLGVIEL
jgi:hypothetical protein